MGTESEQKPTLTLNDPIDKATLKRIGDLQTRRYQLGEMLLELEQEKVKILVEGRRLEDERQKIFTAALTSRGLAPNVPVEVDPETGRITLVKMNGSAPQAQPPASPPAPAPAEQPPA